MSSVPVIDVPLVRRLVAAQFPEWAELPIRPVPIDGWDNRTFRLGDSFVARLPSATGYAAQVRKEIQCLPLLSRGVRLTVPEVVGIGAPSEAYPFEWTVRRWIPGVPVRDAETVERADIAAEVATFLRSLAEVDPTDGPPPGAHSAGRGAGLEQWDDQVTNALGRLRGRIRADVAATLWREARSATFRGDPAWFHGDIATGNLLTTDGHLSAVIDFGCAGVGDPACDLVLAWTYLTSTERLPFRRATGVDDAAWSRGAGWALWKALITLDDPASSATSRFALGELGVL